MKKLLFVIVALLVATNCFAEPSTFIRSVDNNIVSPTISGTTFNNSQTDVGVTAISLGATTGVASIILKPSASNTGMIYIGNSSVTSANGLELATASVTRLDLNKVSGLYAISTTANQKVTVLTVLQ